jgi:hypothetical protein
MTVNSVEANSVAHENVQVYFGWEQERRINY